MNRGIFLSHEKGAKLVVDAGYTLKCNWPITFNGPLYKTQPGTLALGGGVKFYDGTDASDTLPEDPSKRLLIVTNGTLKALSHDCVNGLTVALAKNSSTSLAIDFVEEDCSLKKYGFYNVKTDTPFEAGNSINIQLDGAEGEQIRGKRVVILDDVISTGESLKAVEKLCEKFDADIVAKASVLAEGDAADRNDIVFIGVIHLIEK